MLVLTVKKDEHLNVDYGDGVLENIHIMALTTEFCVVGFCEPNESSGVFERVYKGLDNAIMSPNKKLKLAYTKKDGGACRIAIDAPWSVKIWRAKFKKVIP